MNEDLVSELLETLGEDGFFRLTEAYAGTRLYVPGNIARSELPAEIGHDNAARLSNIFPGSYIKVPLARAFRATRYRANGDSNAQIAVRLGMTEGGIEKLFSREIGRKPQAKKRLDDRQIDLFK